MRKKLKEKISEALSAVLPITGIVLLLSFTLTPMPVGTLMLFLLGAAMLIVGMGFFSLGADLSMMPIGEQMGRKLGGNWKAVGVAAICFLIGAVVTIAEPGRGPLDRSGRRAVLAAGGRFDRFAAPGRGAGINCARSGESDTKYCGRRAGNVVR